MSCSEHFVPCHKQHHKRQIDGAISRAYSRLASDAAAAANFEELLHCVRRRAAGLLEAPVFEGHHPGVEALVNLSRFRGTHIRGAGEWPGTTSTWRRAVWSLAQHLVCRYEVPVFLASSWYSNDPDADQKRGWFVAHSRGASFRSLNLLLL